MASVPRDVSEHIDRLGKIRPHQRVLAKGRPTYQSTHTSPPMSLDTTQLLATAATVYGIGGALSVLLQARQMRARGSSRDVSLRFLATYVGGYAIWLLYGLSMQSVPIVAVNGVGLVSGAVTLSVALRLRGPRPRPAY
jgi:uncharacterized protein with PQ loop repeat